MNIILIQENELFRVTFEEGVFCFEIKRPMKFTEDIAWVWVNFIHDLTAQLGRPYLHMGRILHPVEHSAGGTKLLKAVAHKEYVIANALITPSKSISLLMRLIMALAPTSIYEERTFSDEPEARDWLRKKQTESRYAPVTADEARKLKLGWDASPRPENYVTLQK